MPDPYLDCSIYEQYGACSCSTGVHGNVCPLGAAISGTDTTRAPEDPTNVHLGPDSAGGRDGSGAGPATGFHATEQLHDDENTDAGAR